MNVKEAAKRMGVSHWCIYKQISDERGIGKKFQYRKGKGWFIYAHDVPRAK